MTNHIDGYTVGPVAPESLDAANEFEITLPKANVVSIQAALFTNKTSVFHYRVAKAASLTATALSTAEGFITHGGVAELRLDPTVQYYLYGLLTDADGTAANGGANDYLYISANNQ